MRLLLLFSVAVIATCGLIYELIAGTLASYLLGDSITQFSTVIGVYLFAMGVGSFFSKYIHRNLLYVFIVVEILVGIIGGLSSISLFLLFNYITSFRLALYSIIFATGTLVGLEIPLMMSILKNELEFKDLVSKVFSFDYVGALLASIAFPLFFVPHFGLIRTSLFFGLLNIIIAIVLIYIKQKELPRLISLKIMALGAMVVLITCFVLGEKIMDYAEAGNYNEHVIYSKSSNYQRITVTATKNSHKLYLNGNLQFNSSDEYRYHEALVHPCFILNPTAKTVLILGGGDGLAAREALKYNNIQSIQLVDLDPAMTLLFRNNPILSKLNKQSLSNPKLKITNADAYIWLKENKLQYDIVIVDFPDPSNFSIGKLYSNSFYSELKNHLSKGAIAVIQSTSPYVAPNSYWCIVNTLSSTGFKTLPYHDYVPSFGDWGYIIASTTDTLTSQFNTLPHDLKYLDSAAFVNMQYFPKDIAYRETEITWTTLGIFLSDVIKSCRLPIQNKFHFFRSGANAKAGHLLREPLEKDKTYETLLSPKILIIGGGISGLSAAHYLKEHGESDFLLLELDDQVGGNSKNGENEYSKYPYGAHYLPIPNLTNTEMLTFLTTLGIIKEFDKLGLPIYDDYALCHHPDERLLVNHYWQEGLLPHPTPDDEKQYKRFFTLIDNLKKAIEKIKQRQVF